jgi:hypothetical protein
MCRMYTELHDPPRSPIIPTPVRPGRRRLVACSASPRRCEVRRVLEAPRGGFLCNQTRPPRPKMGVEGAGGSGEIGPLEL